jgi:cell division protein FtsN
MAEDNSARYRSNDSFGRGAAQGAPASDPLAELARLIGRNDPFSEYGRTAASPAAAVPPAQPEFSTSPLPPTPPVTSAYGHVPAQPDPPPSFLSRPVSQFDNPPQRYAEPPQYAEPAQYAEPVPPRYSEPLPPEPYANDSTRYAAGFPAHNDWPGSSAPAQSGQSYSPPPDLFTKLQQELAGQPAAPRYEHQDARVPDFGGQPFPGTAGRSPMDRGQGSDLPGFEPAPFPGMDRPGFGPPFLQGPSASQSQQDKDDFDDEEPRGARRHGLATVFAVLGLAVLGTAGAFAYRSLVGGPRVAAAPPVIHASGEPSKVAPPPAAVADSSAAGKFSYDRFGDAGKDEKVVNREEKPVDLSKAVPPSVARPAFPPPPAPAPNGTSTMPKGQAPSAANPPSALGEPRRVKTVPIRPDQGGDAATAAPAQQPSSRQQSNAQAQGADAAARTKVAARHQAAPVAPPPPAGGGPLSLSPDANNSAGQDFPAAPPPAAAPVRQAAPTRVASAPAAAGGKFLVQVASQKSEADAESAYRGVQSKYGSVLNGQPHQIRRADLGAKGVYYRAMVGPFASREDAVQLCASLKQAGGDCVVQH